METLTYAICNVATDLDNINFNEVQETSRDTIRKSVDGTLFGIKWEEGATPSFISDGTVTPSETLNHADALALMQTSEWAYALPTL